MTRLLKSILVATCLTVLHITAEAAQPIPIQRFHTEHGIPVVFYQAMDIPMLNVLLAFKAGTAYDGQQFGLSTLTTQLLDQGNAGLDATTIATQIADTGAQFASENNRDMVVLQLKTLTEPDALKEATDAFTLIASKPDFPEAAFEREKKLQRMAIQQALESPDTIANQTFFRALYQAHPYAHPTDGDIKTVDAIRLDDVKHFHKQYFVQQNALLVLVGALTRKDAEALAECLTQDIPKGSKAARIPKAKPLPEAMDIHVPFTSSQTVLRLGQLGINHHNPHYFPLMVGNYTLGGGALVSRLAHELREKRGLTYGVNSQFIPLPEYGPFVIGFATEQTQAEAAETLTRDTLTKFIQTGPSEEELKAAKQYLIGSFPLSLASNKSMAEILLKMAFYGLPDDYLDTYTRRIDEVSVDAIRNAFQHNVEPDKLLQVTVGKT